MYGLHEMQLRYPGLAPIHSISTGTSQRRRHILQDALPVLQMLAHGSPRRSRQQNTTTLRNREVLPAELTPEKSPSPLIVEGTAGEVAKPGFSVYRLRSVTVYVHD